MYIQTGQEFLIYKQVKKGVGVTRRRGWKNARSYTYVHMQSYIFIQVKKGVGVLDGRENLHMHMCILNYIHLNRSRKGSGYRDAGDGREQFHMAVEGWHSTQVLCQICMSILSNMQVSFVKYVGRFCQMCKLLLSNMQVIRVYRYPTIQVYVLIICKYTYTQGHVGTAYCIWSVVA